MKVQDKQEEIKLSGTNKFLVYVYTLKCCLFFVSWRYNPLLYFYRPVADFSLLVFEVS
jgi:hypothetical protein